MSLLLREFFEDYQKSIDINNSDEEFFDYKQQAEITYKQKFIDRINNDINTFDVYNIYCHDYELLYTFFMLYQCINLKYNDITSYSSYKIIEINYIHNNICISIQFIGRGKFNYVIYYNALKKNELSITSADYDVYSDDILILKTEFCKSITWYKRVLAFYMMSDFASSNLLNLIPEDVGRYIISQYL